MALDGLIQKRQVLEQKAYLEFNFLWNDHLFDTGQSCLEARWKKQEWRKKPLRSFHNSHLLPGLVAICPTAPQIYIHHVDIFPLLEFPSTIRLHLYSRITCFHLNFLFTPDCWFHGFIAMLFSNTSSTFHAHLPVIYSSCCFISGNGNIASWGIQTRHLHIFIASQLLLASISHQLAYLGNFLLLNPSRISLFLSTTNTTNIYSLFSQFILSLLSVLFVTICQSFKENLKDTLSNTSIASYQRENEFPLQKRRALVEEAANCFLT